MSETNLYNSFVKAIGTDRVFSGEGGKQTWKPKAEEKALIAKAEVFHFENIPWERSEDWGVYILPAPVEVEFEAWVLGLIPLPAPICWFESKVDKPDTEHSLELSVLIKEAGSGWEVTEFFSVESGLAWAVGETATLLRSKYFLEQAAKDKDLARKTGLTVYFALMLGSKTSEKTAGAPEKKFANAKRKEKGLMMLKSHTIVNLVPKRFREDNTGEKQGSPKRLHWRRSHIRKYEKKTPHSSWSELHQAWVCIIPRHLAGRPELGEVSHEYRVR